MILNTGAFVLNTFHGSFTTALARTGCYNSFAVRDFPQSSLSNQRARNHKMRLLLITLFIAPALSAPQGEDALAFPAGPPSGSSPPSGGSILLPGGPPAPPPPEEEPSPPSPPAVISDRPQRAQECSKDADCPPFGYCHSSYWLGQ